LRNLHADRALLSGRPIDPPQHIAKQIAFNCVPQIDQFQDNGYTKEEMKMFWETRKILEDPDIRVNATAVRVPCSMGTRKPCILRRSARFQPWRPVHCSQKRPSDVLDERKRGGYSHCGYRSSEPRHGLRGPYSRRYVACARTRSVDRFGQHPQGCCHEQRANAEILVSDYL